MWRPLRNSYHDDRDWDGWYDVVPENDWERDAIAADERDDNSTYEPVRTVQAEEQAPLVEASTSVSAPVAQPASAQSPKPCGCPDGVSCLHGRLDAPWLEGMTRPDYLGIPRAPAPLPTPPTRVSPPFTPGQVISRSWANFLRGPDARVIVPAPAVAAAAPVIVFPVPQAPAPAPTIAEPGDDPALIGTRLTEDVSGPAGSGKTYQLRELAKRVPAGSLLIAATTGIAAVNAGGGDFDTTTINSIGKYFDTDDLREKFLHGRLMSLVNKYRRAGVTRLVIDEKSMLHPDQLTYWVRAIREANDPTQEQMQAMSGEDVSGYKNLPDLALTLVGDFAQLAPIPPLDPKDPKKRKRLAVAYAFDSPEWHAFAENRTRLTKIWRQDDRAFIDGLQAIRRGDVAAALTFFTPDRFSKSSDDDFVGTTIFATNVEADRYNQIRLDRLQTPVVTARTLRWGEERLDWKNIPDEFHAKVGATVMLLSNEREVGFRDRNGDWHDGEIIYANGDLATIIDVDPPTNQDGLSPENVNLLTTWRVRLARNGRETHVSRVRRKYFVPLEAGRLTALKEQYPNTWTDYLSDDRKKEMIGWVDYLPMRVAYACTTHKTQGLTLDDVQVDIGAHFFKKPAMLYVALSRARTAGRLRIVGDQQTFAQRCVVDPRIGPWL